MERDRYADREADRRGEGGTDPGDLLGARGATLAPDRNRRRRSLASRGGTGGARGLDEAPAGPCDRTYGVVRAALERSETAGT